MGEQQLRIQTGDFRLLCQLGDGDSKNLLDGHRHGHGEANGKSRTRQILFDGFNPG